MALFATIQQAANALQVSQLGLHVTGNNIANANTPGYIRQELIQAPGAGVEFGDVILGYGVRAVGVVQKVDDFVLERLRQTESSLASSQKLDEVYEQLEAVFGELTDSDLSSQLSEFSSSINDVLNQPGNDSLRRLVIERGKTLAGNMRQIGKRLGQIVGELNQEVRNTAEDINRLTSSIAELNKRIVELEGGESATSDAVGLRDERIIALQELSKIIDIRASEQKSGAITVHVGGEYLVSDGIQRPVTVAISDDLDSTYPEVRIADTDSPIQVNGGRLHGIYAARESAAAGTLTKLDGFAQELVSHFNRVHSQGQGLTAFSDVTSLGQTDDPSAALDLAGYPIEIRNGEFEIQVHDLQSGQTQTHSIRLNLTGDVTDSSLEDVRDAVTAISGLTASISPEGFFSIQSDNESLQFSFQNDTSNFLAAAGINTFFTGTSFSDIEVNPVVANDPSKFAASLDGVGAGTDNALLLAEAFDVGQESLGGKSFKQAYEDIVVTTTQDINVQKGVTDGLLNFHRSLESEHLATAGVNLDEEAVKMIFYQRAFQASSRLIQASNELLDVLVNL